VEVAHDFFVAQGTMGFRTQRIVRRGIRSHFATALCPRYAELAETNPNKARKVRWVVWG
jgi:hypothetical protein